MISGDCPYDDCDGPIHLFPPDDLKCPAWAKHTCETCGRVFWEHYSRWNPYALTEDDFNATYTINEETKKLTPREKTG